MSVSAGTSWRGHAIVLTDGVWTYADTGQPVSDRPDRPCGHCGAADTAEGHDGCLGTLPGVRNACCGHGTRADAYVQYDDGSTLRGGAALADFAVHGAAPGRRALRAAITAWDERCDLDFRCPEAGRWPRTWDEYASWAWDHAPAVVAYLRATLPPEPAS